MSKISDRSNEIYKTLAQASRAAKALCPKTARDYINVHRKNTSLPSNPSIYYRKLEELASFSCQRIFQAKYSAISHWLIGHGGDFWYLCRHFWACHQRFMMSKLRAIALLVFEKESTWGRYFVLDLFCLLFLLSCTAFILSTCLHRHSYARLDCSVIMAIYHP